MKHFALILKVALVVTLALPFGGLGAQQPAANPATSTAETPNSNHRPRLMRIRRPHDHWRMRRMPRQTMRPGMRQPLRQPPLLRRMPLTLNLLRSSGQGSQGADEAALSAKQAALEVEAAKLRNVKNADAVIAANARAAAAAKAAREARDVAARIAAPKVNPKVSFTCTFNWNDCDWQYWVIGGGEESALSSQDSQTNPFVSLFVRAPTDNRNGSLWLLARFLGAANANSTGNVVAATQSALGSSSTSGLPQVGTAVDYTIGFQHDWFQPSEKPFESEKGGFTIGGIVGFGATTPLSAQHATTAYVVPSFGTNECDELLKRFPSSRAGLPVQPSTPYIITTTTPSGGTATTMTSGPFCIINPVPITTTTTSNGSTSTVTVSGTSQTDIAFAPEDRNSFLLKYFLGVRLINRWHNQDDTVCGTKAPKVPCTRTVVDLTVGQDEAITGGMLRHFVGKAEAVFPVPKATSICFFGSASMRLSRNQNLSPLILQPATIVTSSPTPPATILLPSTSTWILPLTQPNRDFYRIGIGVDLTDLISKAFGQPKG